MREILPGVLTWTWFSAKHGYDFNGHLFIGHEGNLAVDPVELQPDDLEELKSHGVQYILITNRNHFRDATRLRAATGAHLLMHPGDTEFVQGKGVTVDGALVHGQHVGPFTVVDAHGKSRGEIALHDPKRRLLVIGDACVGTPAGALSLLPPGVIDDLQALRSSLLRMATDLQFDALLLGDGASILTNGRAALKALCAKFPERTA